MNDPTKSIHSLYQIVPTMKVLQYTLFALLALFCWCSAEEFQSSSSEESLENPYDADKLCDGIEQVDLSDFNLEQEDIEKLVKKTIEDKTIQEILAGSEVGEDDDEDDDLLNSNTLKVSLNENGLGSVRKVIVTPDKKKLYTKTLKTSEASGILTTSISGTIKTSLNTNSNGDVGFKVDTNTYGNKNILDEHRTITGDLKVLSNATTKVVKKHKANVVETDSQSSSKGKISWEEENVGDEANGNVNVDIQLDSTVNSHSGTVFLSKKCLASKSSSTFTSKLSGDKWNVHVDGTAKGRVYSHIFAADKNGSSVSWTFAKIFSTSKLSIVTGNETFSGSQHGTIKVFVETITRSLGNGEEDGKKMEISNEIKARVETKSTLDKGYKVYGSGGQVLFRNVILELPTSSSNEDAETNIEEIIYGLIRKLPDNLLTNSFINSVMIAVD